MPHNMAQQLSWSVRCSFKEHINKHSLQAMKIKSLDLTKSYCTLNNLLPLSKQMGKYVKENFPEVRNLKDLKPEHFNAFIEEKARSGDWNPNTITTHTSQLRAIAECSNRASGAHIDSSQIVRPAGYEVNGKDRTQVMSERDFNVIRAHVGDNSTTGRAMDISKVSGLRAADLSRLKAENIHVQGDKAWIEVKGSKNGKNYTANCVGDRMDMMRLEQIKSQVKTGYIFRGDKLGKPIKPDSITSGLRRAINKAGLGKEYPKTGYHSIRKAYAQQNYDNRRAAGMSKDEARAAVCQDLGHSAARGEDPTLTERYFNAW